MPERIAVSVSEAAAIAGLGRTAIYEAIRRGELGSLRVGRRRVLLVDELRRWLEAHRAPLEPLPHQAELAAARRRSKSAGGSAP